jgi:hypothetical protein
MAAFWTWGIKKKKQALGKTVINPPEFHKMLRIS